MSDDPQGEVERPSGATSDVEAARSALNASVSALVTHAHPKNVAQRAVASVKGFVDETIGRGPDADLSVPAWQRVRWDRVGEAGAAVVILLLVRKRRRKL